MPPRPFFIDTHCHLDAAEFDGDRAAVQADAAARGVGAIVIPAVAVSNFRAVAALASRTDGGCYALGIHPMATPHASTDDIATLRTAVAEALDDPRFVAIGEIGLDGFVPALATPDALARQTWFLDAQLKLAREFDLPVLLHVRRAQDLVLAALRRVRHGRPDGGATGIAHAFNGSRQQADRYRALGFRLGLGGAATDPRALRIRALAAAVDDDGFVLETDAPDIPPVWARTAGGARDRNTPGELPAIAASIAALRGTDVATLAATTTRNAIAVLPRLGTRLAALGMRNAPQGSGTAANGVGRVPSAANGAAGAVGRAVAGGVDAAAGGGAVVGTADGPARAGPPALPTAVVQRAGPTARSAASDGCAASAVRRDHDAASAVDSDARASSDHRSVDFAASTVPSDDGAALSGIAASVGAR